MITQEAFDSYNAIIKDQATLILVHGKAHSGKGEVAKHLVKEFGFVEFGFADYLKVIATCYFDWPENLIYNNSERTVDSRSFMQIIGHAGRMFDEDFWIKHLAQKISVACRDWVDAGYSSKFKAVISDLRYPNEMDWGRSVGGRLWKVVRTGDFKKIQAGENHISETALDDRTDWDKVLMNDSTLSSLYKAVSSAFIQ